MPLHSPVVHRTAVIAGTDGGHGKAALATASAADCRLRDPGAILLTVVACAPAWPFGHIAAIL